MGEHLTNTYNSPLDGGRTYDLGCSLGCPLTINITAQEVAKTLWDRVFKDIGIPQKVISD